MNAIASPAPMTAEEARASAHVSIVRAGGVPFVGPRRQWPSDVPDAAHGPRGEREPILDVAPAAPSPPLDAWDTAEPVEPPAVDPDPPTYARPWRPVYSRGDVVPAWDDLDPVRADLAATCARLLAAVASCPALGPVDDYLPGRGEAVPWDEVTQ